MCRNLFVRATDEMGNPHPNMPEGVEFDPDELTKEEVPICTCWIGDEKGKGAILRHTFVEKCLREFLERVHWGNIIIEVR